MRTSVIFPTRLEATERNALIAALRAWSHRLIHGKWPDCEADALIHEIAGDTGVMLDGAAVGLLADQI